MPAIWKIPHRGEGGAAQFLLRDSMRAESSADISSGKQLGGNKDSLRFL